MIRIYRHEVTAALRNVAAATNGLFVTPGSPRPENYLRTEVMQTPEVVTTFPERLEINRTNPYLKPRRRSTCAPRSPRSRSASARAGRW